MIPIDMSIKKKNINSLAFLLSFEDTCALSILYLKMSLASVRGLFTESAAVKKEHFLPIPQWADVRNEASRYVRTRMS